MSTRLGAVITFPPGMTKEQAAHALARFVKAGLIEDPSRPAFKNSKGVEIFPAHSGVESYDDEMGGPVWYIP